MTNSRFQKIFSQFNDWIEKTNYSKKSKINYVSVVKNALAYIESFNIRSLNNVSLDLVLKFIKFRGTRRYAANFIEYRTSVLYLFFKWAHTHGYCHNNLIIEHRKLKLNNKASLHDKKNKIYAVKDLLSQEEQEKLLNFKIDNNNPIAVRNKCILLLILASALYAEEVITLPKSALDLNTGLLSVTNKDTKERVIQLDLGLCKQSCSAWLAMRDVLLKEKKADSLELFFTTNNFSPLIKRVLYKIVSQFLQAVGITKTHSGPEMLRQTAICNMVRRRLSLEEIQTNTGLSLTKIGKYQQLCSLM